jgi:hypothetical protein
MSLSLLARTKNVVSIHIIGLQPESFTCVRGFGRGVIGVLQSEATSQVNIVLRQDGHIQMTVIKSLNRAARLIIADLFTLSADDVNSRCAQF